MRRARAWWGAARRILDHPSNRRSPVGALARAVRWRLLSAVVPGYDPIHLLPSGLRVRCPGRSGAARVAAYFGGVTGPVVDAVMRRYPRPGDLVADVGANVGFTALLAGRAVAPAGRVLAFEAVPGTAAALRANVGLNRLEGVVEVHALAVGARAGDVAMATSDCVDTDHVAPGGAGPGTRVRMTTLADALPDAPFALWKLDVEGFELDVLRGAEPLLARRRVDTIVLEVNGAFARYGYQPADLQALLERHGYRCAGYDPEAGVLTLGGRLWDDVLAVHGGAVERAAARLGARVQEAPVTWGPAPRPPTTGSAAGA